MNDPRKLTILLLVLVLLVAGCSEPEATESRKKPLVYTTFYPTTYFTRRIAGSHAEVVCPLPADADPIFWMPSERIVSDYQRADLVVINGAGLEKWLGKVSLATSKVVDTAAAMTGKPLTYKQAPTHSHGDLKHSHEGIDGHTWMDPSRATEQAGAIHKALARLLPDHAGEFRANFTALAADLDALDRSLADLSKALGRTPLAASHPAYNYLVDRYKWNVENFDLDPATVPSDDVLAELRKKLADHPAKILLWESAPTKDIAAKIEVVLGLRSVVFSPCETLSPAAIAAGDDYLSIMKRNIARLRAAIQPE